MLRSTVNKIFGALERHIQALQHPTNCSITIKIKVVYAATALHNSISQIEKNEGISSVMNEVTHDEVLAIYLQEADSHNEIIKMSCFQDKITKNMWHEYKRKLQHQ